MKSICRFPFYPPSHEKGDGGGKGNEVEKVKVDVKGERGREKGREGGR